ncbi:PcfK-like family protein [Galbibacter sp. BG1]
MKGTNQFKEVIKSHLKVVAQKDDNFSKKLKNPNKNLDDCISYILNQVQKSGCVGFADDEIYGMAMHYYDEENVKVEDMKDCKVIVNHKAELTEEEIQQAKEEARKKVVNEQRQKMKEKKKPQPKKVAKTESNELTLF